MLCQGGWTYDKRDAIFISAEKLKQNIIHN